MYVCCQHVVSHSQNCLCKNNWVKRTISEYVIKTIYFGNIDKYSRWCDTKCLNCKIIVYENKVSYVDMKYDITYKHNCMNQTNKLWSIFLLIGLW